MIDDESEDTPDPHDFTDPSPDPAHDADLAALCDALQGSGVTRVVIHYEGSGDSGSVEEIESEPETVSLPRSLEDRLRDVAEGYCPDGYENNEGGYGALIVYPALGLAELEHRDRYEDAEEMDARAATLPEEIRLRLSRLGITRV